ncbi:replicative DNA helicase [Oscillatoria nigro-viridis PCC 7112]|uniref:Replicative DNA helicase n=2 Tax=Cyanophyceae TaxID=3028117 RepID=K9VL64_9CYAN|nr:replicative DNA helicase [Oscillatoria nigro-viridis]AFZ07965.1 replicative DNA helicase [Oscillatoria nigro-viridis PCC 7112]
MSDLMPTNIEAEEAILGGILIDPEAISRIAELLRPEFFAITAHQVIYRSALALFLQGQPTDLMTVTTSLTDRNQLEQVGGLTKLAQLVDRTVSAVNIDQYAVLVEDKYQRRKLIEAGNNIVQLGYETATPLETVLDRAEQEIFSITQERPQQDLVSIGETLNQTFQDLENRNEGLTLPGIPCGFYDLDAMTGGFQRSDLIIVAARPAMGKCCTDDSVILQSDGSLVTLEEIYQKRQAELLTLGEDWQFHLTRPSAFIDDGIKPVFRVTTKLGRFIETTITHPFLTIKGWRHLAQIQAGDKIAVPRRMNVFGKETIRSCEVKLLAYLIGDGCLTRSAPKFTNGNTAILQDFAEAATSFGGLKLRFREQGKRTPEYYVMGDREGYMDAINTKHKNPLRLWLEELGLMGKNAHQKTVPEIVFKLERSQVALFLNRLFSTDGWATVLSSGQSQLGYCSVSEGLARHVQHLLLRFGIIAALKKRSVKYKNTRKPAWQIDIADAKSIKTFISEIGIFGKEVALFKVKEALENKEYQTNRDLIPVEAWEYLALAKGNESWASLAKRAGIKGHSNIHVGKRALSRERFLVLATALDNLWLKQLADSEVYWDEIVSIEPMGNKQVYDLTIPETHNFVANDICVHNTAFCTNIAHHIAAGQQKLPVAVFSLEMSKEQLVQRILSSEAKIESNRLRSGRISQNEWEPISTAIGNLSELPLFIDDTPNITVTEIRSKVRRLQAEQGGTLGLVLLDYLQLMEGTSDNRVQELSRITRSLKGLARELNVPIIALSQLSRGVEARTNKRPMMSDLRESGCLTGDSLVMLADTGVRVPIRELVGKSGFTVWALNEATMQLEKAVVSNAFATGVKPVLRLQTRLGRAIRATGNHKFLTIHGWRGLDELKIGDRIALPRYVSSSFIQSMDNAEIALLGHMIGDGCTLPRHVIQYTTREEDLANTVANLAIEVFGERIIPRICKERDWYQVYLPAAYHLTHNVRNPVTEWLDALGVFGMRSHQKFVPNQIFEQPQEAIALFLRHLWSTDGCIKTGRGKCHYPSVYYASSSEKLARDVQSLLLRLGINARLFLSPQPGKGRDQHQVWVTGRPDLDKFIHLIGAVGNYKQQALTEIAEYIEIRSSNTNRDVIPRDVWKMYAVPAMQQFGLTTRQMQAQLGNLYCGTTLYKHNLGRERAFRLATIVKSGELALLSKSDIYWDEIASIEVDGEAEVYDLTVPALHNFVANDIIVHNSIEQDADLVIMLYRDEYYNPDSPDRGIAEVIITKHRNGPTGIIKLLFDAQFTCFRNLASPKRS